jgi:hypothetical protein
MDADTAMMIALRPIIASLIALYIGKPFRAACHRWIPEGKVKRLLLFEVWQ